LNLVTVVVSQFDSSLCVYEVDILLETGVLLHCCLQVTPKSEYKLLNLQGLLYIQRPTVSDMFLSRPENSLLCLYY
jgi:hypothetical protein